jgi:hypothetical protein
MTGNGGSTGGERDARDERTVDDEGKTAFRNHLTALNIGRSPVLVKPVC